MDKCGLLLCKFRLRISSVKKNEIVGTYNTHGGEKRCIRGFGGENLSKELEDLGVDGKVMLK